MKSEIENNNSRMSTVKTDLKGGSSMMSGVKNSTMIYNKNQKELLIYKGSSAAFIDDLQKI
jgi:hypothetical protein